MRGALGKFRRGVLIGKGHDRWTLHRVVLKRDAATIAGSGDILPVTVRDVGVKAPIADARRRRVGAPASCRGSATECGP